MSMARSKSEIFQLFKEEHVSDGYRWRAYWADYWMQQIKMLKIKGWYVVPCAQNSKSPEAGYPWTDNHLGEREMLYAAGAGQNLAVVMGASNLVVLDYDQKLDLDAMGALRKGEPQTLTLITPKGFQLWTRAPSNMKEVQMAASVLKRKGFESVRFGNQYALVPLSQTCAGPEHLKGGCGDDHDWRIREWVDDQAQVLPFREVLEALV
jgi:hypothetical protein